MPPDVEHRTEPATPKRRREAREKGQVARSQEVSTVAILAAAIAGLCLWGPTIAGRLGEFMRFSLVATESSELVPSSAIGLVRAGVEESLSALSPLLAVLVVGALAASYGQVGFLFMPQAALPRLGRINPINGATQLVSIRSVVRLLVAVAKFGLIAGVATLSVWTLTPKLMAMAGCTPLALLRTTSWEAFVLLAKITFALATVSVVDYLFQRWKHERDLKMTKQEVRDELKLSEGDPTTKGRIRRVQREMSLRRMMHDVPKADVVVTNPTHFAVALQYDRASMPAPLVLAKGADFIAKRIIEIAKEHDVPVMEDKPVAQALYRTAEIGETIPPQLYRAVARILAYIYGLKGIRV